uniref:Retrotransposable element Tf2 n=1 Tax=Cajanus cajan TaxID=3821 RepID=A0A151U4R1_CAJCA|nr:Retrotransposable element Tf2 [Cajanus cajan]
MPSVAYLGHIISGQGVQPDPEKIQAIVAWPPPRSLTALRGFLGLTGFYRKFVRNYAAIATPLTDLLCSPTFQWSLQAQQAFTELKSKITSVPVLALPDFNSPFVIETNASGTAIGVVLSQHGHPIAFFSKRLCPKLQAAFVYVCEMLAVTEAIKKWRQELVNKLLQVDNGQDLFTFCNGLLYFKERLFVPDLNDFRLQLLKEFHCTPVAGHSGLNPTVCRLAAIFYWPGLYSDARKFIRECPTCQHNKYMPTKKFGLLQPLKTANRVWEDISMDFITHLPKSFGHSTIWVVCDRLTKFAHFIALPAHFTAPQLARRFMVEIFKIHGFPKSIVLDRDPLFVSSFWRELFRAQGTTLAFSSAYHPQSDGQSEVLNRCLEAYLRCFVSDHPRAWYQYLHLAEYWHNTSFHTSIDTSPFHALYGRAPPSPTDALRDSSSTSVDLLLQEHKKILTEIKVHLSKARQRMKHFVNLHYHDVTFQPSDWVLLKLQPYRQTSVLRRTSQKLAKRYYGPFQIRRCIGSVAYELLLPDTARIHPVFHVSLLRPYKGNDPLHHFRDLSPHRIDATATSSYLPSPPTEPAEGPPSNDFNRVQRIL